MICAVCSMVLILPRFFGAAKLSKCRIPLKADFGCDIRVYDVSAISFCSNLAPERLVVGSCGSYLPWWFWSRRLALGFRGSIKSDVWTFWKQIWCPLSRIFQGLCLQAQNILRIWFTGRMRKARSGHGCKQPIHCIQGLSLETGLRFLLMRTRLFLIWMVVRWRFVFKAILRTCNLILAQWSSRGLWFCCFCRFVWVFGRGLLLPKKAGERRARNIYAGNSAGCVWCWRRGRCSDDNSVVGRSNEHLPNEWAENLKANNHDNWSNIDAANRRYVFLYRFHKRICRFSKDQRDCELEGCPYSRLWRQSSLPLHEWL